MHAFKTVTICYMQESSISFSGFFDFFGAATSWHDIKQADKVLSEMHAEQELHK